MSVMALNSSRTGLAPCGRKQPTTNGHRMPLARPGRRSLTVQAFKGGNNPREEVEKVIREQENVSRVTCTGREDKAPDMTRTRFKSFIA